MILTETRKLKQSWQKHASSHSKTTQNSPEKRFSRDGVERLKTAAVTITHRQLLRTYALIHFFRVRPFAPKAESCWASYVNVSFSALFPCRYSTVSYFFFFPLQCVSSGRSFNNRRYLRSRRLAFVRSFLPYSVQLTAASNWGTRPNDGPELDPTCFFVSVIYLILVFFVNNTFNPIL